MTKLTKKERLAAAKGEMQTLLELKKHIEEGANDGGLVVIYSDFGGYYEKQFIAKCFLELELKSMLKEDLNSLERLALSLLSHMHTTK